MEGIFLLPSWGCIFLQESFFFLEWIKRKKTLWKRQRFRGLEVLSRAETHEKGGRYYNSLHGCIYLGTSCISQQKQL